MIVCDMASDELNLVLILEQILQGMQPYSALTKALGEIHII